MNRYMEVCNLMQQMGWQVKTEHYYDFAAYVDYMLKQKRVIFIQGVTVQAIIFFFLTDDFTTLYKKRTWALAIDNPEGKQIYIDKLICRYWTKNMRQSLEEAILERFPHVEEAIYHRAPKDRCVRIKRGVKV